MSSPKPSAKPCATNSLAKPADSTTVPPATPRRYAKGVAFQVIGRLGQASCALAIMALLTRRLGVSAVGIFATWEAIFTLLDVIVDGGSGAALVRRGGANPSSINALLKKALRFRFITLIIASICVYLIAPFDSRISPSDPSLILCTIGLWFHLLGTYNCIFHLKLEFHFPSVVRITSALLGLSLAVAVAVYGSDNPLHYLAAIALARILGNTAIWIGAKYQLKKWKQDSSTEGIFGFEKEAILLGLGWLVRESYGRLDIIFLRIFAGPASAGIYAPIRKTFTLAMQIPSFVNNVAMPSLSSQVKKSDGSFEKHVSTLTKNMCMFVVPAAIVAAPFAFAYLDLAFGSEYSATGLNAMYILIGAGIFVFPTSVLLTALIARDHAQQALKVSLIALSAFLVGNFFWVRDGDVNGAALARLLTESLALFAALYYFCRARQQQIQA